MSSTYNEHINYALKEIGVLGQGESASGDKATEAMYFGNELLDEWQARTGMNFAVTTGLINLINGQDTYTIGPTGDLVTPTRPNRLTGAWIRNNTTTPANDTPLIPLTATEYGNIIAKSIGSGIPYAYWYNPEFENGQLKIFPVPNAGKQILVYMPKPLAQVTINDLLVLPPAYQKAFRLSLAIAVANSYGIIPLLATVAGAQRALQAINKNNLEIPRMGFDLQARGLYNINIDSTRVS